MSDERARVAEELRRIRDAVRERALLDPPGRHPVPPPRETALEPLPPPERPDAPEPPPPRPDAGGVNALWNVTAEGGRFWVLRFLRRLLVPSLGAQTTFNASQVQLDNEILAYIDARFERTHSHYDRVLGHYGRHLTEADERHMILQEELVAHVHDLVKRIDLVLAEVETGRLGLESALRDLRQRVTRLEERLPRG